MIVAFSRSMIASAVTSLITEIPRACSGYVTHPFCDTPWQGKAKQPLRFLHCSPRTSKKAPKPLIELHARVVLCACTALQHTTCRRRQAPGKVVEVHGRPLAWQRVAAESQQAKHDCFVAVDGCTQHNALWSHCRQLRHSLQRDRLQAGHCRGCCDACLALCATCNDETMAHQMLGGS